MSTERTLARIDATLEDYDQWDGHSPDAARWAGEPTEGEWPSGCEISFSGEPRLWMVEPENPEAPTMAELENATELTNVVRLHYGEPSDFTFPQRVIVGMDPASQHAHITVVPETQPFVDAMRRIAEAMIQLVPELNAIKRQAEAETGKSWAYLVQRSERPMAAAERTCSPRRRAGSRRTKRQARRRG